MKKLQFLKARHDNKNLINKNYAKQKLKYLFLECKPCRMS